MKFYEWNNTYFDCDVFACFTSKELSKIKAYYGKNDLQAATLQGSDYYFFINTKIKKIAPMSCLAYAFGGGYNGYPPYGDKIKGFKFKCAEYELVTDDFFIELARTRHNE